MARVPFHAFQFSPPLPGDQTNMIPRRLPPDQTNRTQYYLVFLNEVGDRIYANDLVKAENGDPIKVAIKYTQSIRSPDRSLSSARVILRVLDDELWENKGETWSWSEFNQRVLSGRNGKGPILIGPSLTIPLENGVGTFGNFVFNDNSSWTKSKSFRLGVMVESDGEEGYLNGERVQEGVSKPFRVMDRKSKASEKPEQLKLTDNVLSIMKIGPRRADLLKNSFINTVEGFLKLYYYDEPKLRKILNIKSECDVSWMSMVAHATQCANEFHAKYNAPNLSSHSQLHVNAESRSILNGDSVQCTNDSGSPQIDPFSYLMLDSLKGNTSFLMEGCDVSGGSFGGPCSGGNDGGGSFGGRCSSGNDGGSGFGGPS